MKVSPYAGETLLVGILLSPLTWRATSGLGYYPTQVSLVLLGEVAQSLCCPGRLSSLWTGKPGHLSRGRHKCGGSSQLGVGGGLVHLYISAPQYLGRLNRRQVVAHVSRDPLCVCVCAQSLNSVRLFSTPWTVACQAPLSMGFPSKNTGVCCHFLLQGNLPNPGMQPEAPKLPHWQAGSLLLSHWGSPREIL